MPKGRYGQLITFSTERDEDQRLSKWVWVHARKGETVRKIATRRGHPEDARRIADENKIRSASKVLKKGRRIKVPGEAKATAGFSAYAGDQPPRITSGYAKLSILDRPNRMGLVQLDGYDPMEMEVPLRFLADDMTNGTHVERDCTKLEQLAGRGQFHGTASGPAAIVRVSTTDGNGYVVPLIPSNYQWSHQNPSAPIWRIASIDWDADPRRDGHGRRVDQQATVTLWQHTRINLTVRSASHRAKGRG